MSSFPILPAYLRNPPSESRPPLRRLALAARLHLSTLTWEQLLAALQPLAPRPSPLAEYILEYRLRPRLTTDLPRLLQKITYWEYLLYPEVFSLPANDQEAARTLYDYIPWKIFREGTLTPMPPLQALELPELPNYRRAAHQWQEQVLRQRRAVKEDLESFQRCWPRENLPAAGGDLPALAEQIRLEVTFHPIPPPPPPAAEPAAYLRYKELEWRFQESHRRRLREQSKENPKPSGLA